MPEFSHNDLFMDFFKTLQIPDVVLVKKHFADKALRNRKRKWKLKHMAGFPHMDTESCNDEFNDFAVRTFSSIPSKKIS